MKGMPTNYNSEKHNQNFNAVKMDISSVRKY